MDMEVYSNSEVTFKGCCIGESSTHAPGKDRWVEIYIFQTEAGSFVAEVYGMSNVDGEEDRETIHVAETEADLVECLRYRGRLSRPAREAVEDAAKTREAFARATIKHIK